MTLKAWHTQFIIEYLKNGENGLQAYKTVKPNVSDETAGVNACKLLKETNVTLELHRLREKTLDVAVSTLQISQSKLTNNAETFINMAIEDRNPNAGLKGVELQAKLHGILDKRERESSGWVNLINELTINVTPEAKQIPEQVIDAELDT